MTDPAKPPADDRADDRPVDPSVLSNLTGTRPQRRSPKRPASPTSHPAPPTPAAPKPPPKRPAAPPTAAQGYESAPQDASANPPTGTELLASIAHAATELTDITLSLAKRLVRTALDRLP